MPLHLEGIMKQPISPEDLQETVEELYNTPTSSFSSINRFYHLRTEMVDENTGDIIGHFVLSVIRNEKADRNDVVDTDLSFKSDEPVRLWFEQMAGPTVYGSQGYEAITLDDDIEEQYLYLETVNRYTDYPNLNTHEADVYISVFPKEVSMYDSMEALNGATGKEYSDRFIEECEDVSFLTGTVQSVRDVKVVKGKLDMSFVLADVKTVLGTVPVAMSRDVFDIDGIAPGRVLAMKAHISADLASDEVFTYHDK